MEEEEEYITVLLKILANVSTVTLQYITEP
jgi:hypothetical protein